MNLRFSIAVQGVEMNCLLFDLNTRASDEGGQRRSICTRMLVKRIQYKHAFGQNSRQHRDHYLAAVAGIEQSSGDLGMSFMVLYVHQCRFRRAAPQRNVSLTRWFTERKWVDVSGIEPVTPCLQSIGLDSIRSIRY